MLKPISLLIFKFSITGCVTNGTDDSGDSLIGHFVVPDAK